MRTLELVYRRGRGFDLYDVEPGRARELVASSLTVPTLARLVLHDGPEVLGRWLNRNAGPALQIGKYALQLLGKKVA